MSASKLNYADPADRDRLELRLRALDIAHDREMVPSDVVARAKEYIAFVEAE